MADPTLRASHDDRAAILQVLEQHTVAGRLSLTEFDQRTASALTALTLDELSALTADLPDLPTPAAEPVREPAGHSRYLALVFLIAFSTVALLLAIMLLRP